MGTVCRVLGPLRTVPAICGCFLLQVFLAAGISCGLWRECSGAAAPESGRERYLIER